MRFLATRFKMNLNIFVFTANIYPSKTNASHFETFISFINLY